MWLLEIDTVTLKEFNRDIPPYAILSHRWEEEEVSFEDIKGSPQHMKGYRKIQRSCEEARKENFAYVWVDTCCIDKKSSAELSEAINSMYKWYEDAAICYVYLSDVDDWQDIGKSLWFTRGWTLQELLAPCSVEFYSRSWTLLASKNDLASELQRITSIPRQALFQFNSSEYRIATKMSWAAHRTTTREEDLAYCLLGIFNVNMPLLYGEGQRAFQRLQEEISRVSIDLSLFLWQGEGCSTFGALAAAPICFANTPSLWDRKGPYEEDELVPRRDLDLARGWSTNNAGLSITLILQPCLLTETGEKIYLAYLSGEDDMQTGTYTQVIFIREDPQGVPGRFFRRIAVDDRTWHDRRNVTYSDGRWDREALSRSVPITLIRQPVEKHSSLTAYKFCLEMNLWPNMAYQISKCDNYFQYLTNWNVQKHEATHYLQDILPIKPLHAPQILTAVLITNPSGYLIAFDFLILIGIDFNFEIWCMFVPFYREKEVTCNQWKLYEAYEHLLPLDKPHKNEILDNDTGVYLIRTYPGKGMNSRRHSVWHGISLEIKRAFKPATGICPYVFTHRIQCHL